MPPKPAAAPRPSNVSATGARLPMAPVPTAPAAPKPVDPFSPQALKFYAGLPDPYKEYIDTLNSSIDTQRASLDSHLVQAMGSLGQRRDAAAKTYAALPSQLANTSAFSQGGLQNAGAAEQSALSSDVQGRYGAQLQQPITDAGLQRNDDVKFQESLQPLLESANTANYTVGADRLNAEHMAGEQGLEQQRAGIAGQIALAKIEDANHTRDMFLQHGFDMEKYGAQTKADEAKQGLEPSGIPGLNITQVNKVKGTDAYTNWSGIINRLVTNPQGFGANEWGVYANAFANMPPDQRAVLFAENPEFAQMLPTWSQGQGEGEKVPSGYDPTTQKLSTDGGLGHTASWWDQDLYRFGSKEWGKDGSEKRKK